MAKRLLSIAALCLLTACSSSNPFMEDDTDDGTGTGTGTDTGTDPIDSDRSLPPGTTSPSPVTSIVRYEDIDDMGGGYARNIKYHSASDEFEVDNLAFDGDNRYSRGTAVSSLGPFAVYEGDATTTDPVTGQVINTLNYRAIYGVSSSGQTEFAIVRTGSYRDYGFGGFIYQRNQNDAAGNPVSLVLPTEGDAMYQGAYAGTRVFAGAAGQEFVTGDATITVDFKDFNDDKRGVALYVNNRRLYDSAGNDITAAYLAAIQASSTTKTVIHDRNGAGVEVLPDIVPVISPAIGDANGELLGDVSTITSFSDGTSETLDEGKYYAVMSGTNAEEIVGVLVMESDDARLENVTVQETGGFIVYRQ